jgi:hypothetical protein
MWADGMGEFNAGIYALNYTGFEPYAAIRISSTIMTET